MIRMIWNVLIVAIGSFGSGAVLMVLAGIYAPVLDRVLAACLLLFFIAMIADAVIDLTRSGDHG